MRFPLPFWLVKRLARDNPWLLSGNMVHRETIVRIWPFVYRVGSSIQLTPDQLARLEKEEPR